MAEKQSERSRRGDTRDYVTVAQKNVPDKGHLAKLPYLRFFFFFFFFLELKDRKFSYPILDS